MIRALFVSLGIGATALMGCGPESDPSTATSPAVMRESLIGVYRYAELSGAYQEVRAGTKQTAYVDGVSTDSARLELSRESERIVIRRRPPCDQRELSEGCGGGRPPRPIIFFNPDGNACMGLNTPLTSCVFHGSDEAGSEVACAIRWMNSVQVKFGCY